MLRAFVIGFGVVLVAGGVVLTVVAPRAWFAGAELFIFGALVIGGTLFERWRYRGNVDRASTTWESTGERFRDPVSGELVEVAYDPASGERDYRPVGP